MVVVLSHRCFPVTTMRQKKRKKHTHRDTTEPRLSTIERYSCQTNIALVSSHGCYVRGDSTPTTQHWPPHSPRTHRKIARPGDQGGEKPPENKSGTNTCGRVESGASSGSARARLANGAGLGRPRTDPAVGKWHNIRENLGKDNLTAAGREDLLY